MNDTFDDGSDSDDEGINGDDRQRLMRTNTVQSIQDSRTVHDGGRPQLEGVAMVPSSGTTPHSVAMPARPYTSNMPYNSYSQNDGVFANLNAKPERGEKVEEQPPVCCLLRVLYRPVLTDSSLTNLRQQTLHHLIGTQRSSPRDILLLPTKFTSMVCPSAPFSPLSGMA